MNSFFLKSVEFFVKKISSTFSYLKGSVTICVKFWSAKACKVTIETEILTQ